MNIELNNELYRDTTKELGIDLGCDHDPNSPMASLVRINKKTMVYPERVDFLCSKCRESFSFIRLNGRYTNAN